MVSSSKLVSNEGGAGDEGDEGSGGGSGYEEERGKSGHEEVVGGEELEKQANTIVLPTLRKK